MQLLPVGKTEKPFFTSFFFFRSLYRQVKSTLLTNAKKKKKKKRIQKENKIDHPRRKS